MCHWDRLRRAQNAFQSVHLRMDREHQSIGLYPLLVEHHPPEFIPATVFGIEGDLRWKSKTLL